MTAGVIARPHLSRNTRPRRAHVRVRGGDGAVFRDVDGKSYLDLSSQTVNLLQGQCHPAVVAAVEQQLHSFTFFDQDFRDEQDELAVADLANLLPAHLTAFNMKMNNGSDAVESAIKQTRRASGRSTVLTVDGIYLGQTNQTIHMRGLAPRPEDILIGSRDSVVFGPMPYCETRDHDPLDCPVENGTAFADTVRAHADSLSCVLIDPILISAGAFGGRAHETWCRTIAAAAHEAGVALVVDESQTFGWVPGITLSRLWELEPDLLVLSKGVAAGLPLAVCAATEQFDNLEWGEADYTNGGNPLSVAALRANCTLLADPVEQAAFDSLVATLDELVDTLPGSFHVRGLGLIRGLEWMPDGVAAGRSRTRALSDACLGEGVYVRPYRSTLGVKPPRVITGDQLADGLATIDRLARRAEHEKET